MSDLALAIKQIEGIEASLTAFQKKAEKEMEAAGSVSIETKNALEAVGEKQRELADRLLDLEQKGAGYQNANGLTPEKSVGHQFVDSDKYKAFVDGQTGKVRLDIQMNTSTGSDANVAPDRRAGVVPGAFQPLRMEQLWSHLPTSSNAIEFTKEATFVNNAAEAAEAATKAESDLTWSLVNMPVSTVAHWTKISKQLAADNMALAAYINTRMAYGVDRRVETQLVSGNGTAPNISGLLDTGNFTAHGYASAALGSVLQKFALVRLIKGDMEAAGYVPNAVVLNPADYAQLDVDSLQATGSQIRVDFREDGTPTVWGLPIVSAVGMTADNVAVIDAAAHGTIYDRQSTVVELSEHDGTNFQQNLITVRAERRLALATEVPAACRAGDLTPV